MFQALTHWLGSCIENRKGVLFMRALVVTLVLMMAVTPSAFGQPTGEIVMATMYQSRTLMCKSIATRVTYIERVAERSRHR
jgi:hypothetical protein